MGKPRPGDRLIVAKDDEARDPGCVERDNGRVVIRTDLAGAAAHEPPHIASREEKLAEPLNDEVAKEKCGRDSHSGLSMST